MPGSWGRPADTPVGAPAGPDGGAPFAQRPDPTAARAPRVDDLDEDDDEDDDEDAEERPRHPYTWLHLIVLALVAFVLGFLIVLLLNNARGEEPTPNAAPPAAATDVSAPLIT
ncbi:hypothetical protein OMK64_06530 [Cellulomonas fimi]|uniref:hypothetical protein n=1 Tax=Cellulomonas fimi TaxID=1708 RepID=UPI00234CAB27|nr:hypothetical protein [Cellulomonas fimi]MDC7121188.1 hypothetical protein [Cellulomonas fimi]